MTLRQSLEQAVLHLLRPLVRLLLRHGLSYDRFAELARRAYVEVAERDFTLAARKQTTSRISVITGLNRKEVARLQALNAQGDGGGELARTMNRAARVAAGWLQEHTPVRRRPGGAARGAAGSAAGGAPRPLHAEAFAELVRRHSGDMPARAVLDELRHAGALTEDAKGRFLLAPQGYVPQATDTRKITLLGQHAAELLGAIDHNLALPAEDAWLQQRVFAEHIPAERLDAVRARLREFGQQALAQTRQALMNADGGDAPPASGARRVSLGVYYFEDAATPAGPAPAPASATELATRRAPVPAAAIPPRSKPPKGEKK